MKIPTLPYLYRVPFDVVIETDDSDVSNCAILSDPPIYIRARITTKNPSCSYFNRGPEKTISVMDIFNKAVTKRTSHNCYENTKLYFPDPDTLTMNEEYIQVDFPNPAPIVPSDQYKYVGPGNGFVKFVGDDKAWCMKTMSARLYNDNTSIVGVTYSDSFTLSVSDIVFGKPNSVHDEPIKICELYFRQHEKGITFYHTR